MLCRRRLSPAAAAIVLGLAGAYVAVRLLAALLYGVAPADPVTFTSVAVLMGSVAALASYLPARRAMRLDPVIALRSG